MALIYREDFAAGNSLFSTVYLFNQTGVGAEGVDPLYPYFWKAEGVYINDDGYFDHSPTWTGEFETYQQAGVWVKGAGALEGGGAGIFSGPGFWNGTVGFMEVLYHPTTLSITELSEEFVTAQLIQIAASNGAPILGVEANLEDATLTVYHRNDGSHDGTVVLEGAPMPVVDEPYLVRVEWQCGTWVDSGDPVAEDGFVRVWINGELVYEATNISLWLQAGTDPLNLIDGLFIGYFGLLGPCEYFEVWDNLVPAESSIVFGSGTVEGPDPWIRINFKEGATTVERAFAEVELNHPADYHGGYKYPSVTEWHRIQRGLSDHTGEIQHLIFGAKLADTVPIEDWPTHFWRALLDDPTRKFLTNRPATVEIIDFEDALLGLEPMVIANGFTGDYSPDENFRFDVKGHDWLKRRFTRNARTTENWQPRILAQDFPNANGTVITTEGTAKDYFNIGRVIPIIYGRITDTNLADSPFGPWQPITGYNDTFDPLTDQGDGQFVPIYVGDYQLNGETWRGALVAAHYCAHIEAAFLFHDPVDLRNDPDWLTPRQSANWQAAFGPGSTQQPIVINGRDYCMIFIKGYAGDVFAGVEPIPEIRQGKFGNVPIAINVYGRTDNGNGEGILLTDGFDIYLDFLTNYVAPETPWVSGLALSIPFFPTMPTVQIINSASFESCVQAANLRLGGGYPLDFVIGDNNREESLMSVIAEFHVNLDCEHYWNRLGQYCVTMEPEDETDYQPALDDVIDITKDTFKIVDQVQRNFWNVLPFRHTFDYAGRMQRQFNTDWRSEMTGDLERRHESSIAGYEQERPSGVYEFRFIRGRNRPSDSPWYAQGRAAAEDIMMHLAARYADPMRVVSLALPLKGLHYECGDIFPLTNVEGIGASGWTGRFVRIINHHTDLETRQVFLDCYDLRSVIEQREELTNTFGTSPLASPTYSPVEIGNPFSPVGSPVGSP